MRLELASYRATISNPAQLQVCDSEEQRQCRHEADRERKRHKQAATCDAYRAAMEQNPGWFLDIKYQTCFTFHYITAATG